MYTDNLSIIIKGKPREDVIPKANLILQQLHEWSFQNDLLVDPLKCEAAWFTMSTQTEDNLDPDHKFPLLYAGHEIHVSTLGSTNKPKLLGIPLDPRLPFNNAATAQSFATSTRIAKSKSFANKNAGESAWALDGGVAKNTLMRTQANLARIVSGVPSTTDPESALLEANMMPIRILAFRARFEMCELVRACQKVWHHRPPP
ncbi:hypothetical protein LSM04_006803 [Trypanosoma melophagium]|uniref:uncharacterized protein n=1 Tax=Trypanosoma melophagium TaxID=715481 RepID=UPI00351A8DED|nr:hypothetical protein LSM04_006803 [Trypanosoma melophagium]